MQQRSVPLLSPLLHAQTPIGPPGNVPCAPPNPILLHSHMTWALLWQLTAEWSVDTAEAAKVCRASDHPLLHPLPSLFPVGPVNVAQSRRQSRKETRAWSLRSKHLRGDRASRHVCPHTEPAKQSPSQDLVDKAMTSSYPLGQLDRKAAAPSREVFSIHLSSTPHPFGNPAQFRGLTQMSLLL